MLWSIQVTLFGSYCLHVWAVYCLVTLCQLWLPAHQHRCRLICSALMLGHATARRGVGSRVSPCQCKALLADAPGLTWIAAGLRGPVSVVSQRTWVCTS